MFSKTSAHHRHIRDSSQRPPVQFSLHLARAICGSGRHPRKHLLPSAACAHCLLARHPGHIQGWLEESGRPQVQRPLPAPAAGACLWLECSLMALSEASAGSQQTGTMKSSEGLPPRSISFLPAQWLAFCGARTNKNILDFVFLNMCRPPFQDR